MRLADPKAGVESRRGGAGPSDHKAITIDGMTVMVPVHTAPAFESPYVAEAPDRNGNSRIVRNGIDLGRISFPKRPRFYDLTTEDGIPYSKIAVLHGRDVLATTVLQTCIRYQSRTKTCQFCAIGQSLAAGRTIERKTPAQLAAVAKAAVELDGVKHMVLTTGTPPGNDRGAAILAESARAIKAAVDLPIQGQCEPPDDDAWFTRMYDAGIDTLGMHLEAVTPSVRSRIMPGKATVPLSRYLDAFAAAVPVFGRGQVSTYILAGLGDTPDAILGYRRNVDRTGRLPLCRAVRADLRNAARKPPRPDRRLHGLHPRPARLDAAASRPARHRHQGRLRQMRRLLRALHLRAEGPRMIIEPVRPFLACEFRVKFATLPWERNRAAALRRQVFCEEQRLFQGDDRDAIDDIAIPLVALSSLAITHEDVVGTVRIHEAEPGLWWGSRLAVARPYRKIGAIGTSLIRLAVSSAHARGCRRFLAHVQSQNATLFHALHWQTLDEVTLHGHPHHFMQADLAWYPPLTTPETGFLSHLKQAA